LLLVPVWQEQQQVVHDGHKMRLHLVGRRRGRPGFLGSALI
jgi:hypothetical protein